MQKTRVTVFFEGSFWVAVYERQAESGLEVCRIVFGAEPKDYEVYEFLLQNWHKLRFSPVVEAKSVAEGPRNPKRMQRPIQKQLAKPGVGTKAQQAIQLMREGGKTARKQQSRLKREQEKERQFQLRQLRNKEKHKGR